MYPICNHLLFMCVMTMQVHFQVHKTRWIKIQGPLRTNLASNNVPKATPFINHSHLAAIRRSKLATMYLLDHWPFFLHILSTKGTHKKKHVEVMSFKSLLHLPFANGHC